MLPLWLVNLRIRVMSKYRYFSDGEFKLAQPACSLDQMDDAFMCLLDNARHIAGVPFFVNSAFRSVSYELSKGRSGNSMHTQGKALDIRCVTNDMRYCIVSALIAVGFRRIGIGSSFIHVDSGYPDAVNPIIWLY